jgi:hypothetical protein
MEPCDGDVPLAYINEPKTAEIARRNPKSTSP